MEKEVDISTLQDRIIFTEKVAHVTFYLVREELPIDLPDGKWDDGYLVYSAPEKQTILKPLENYPDPAPYDDAMKALHKAAQKLEAIIEKKRKSMPTPQQLHFLFREKIPIPLTLTWGEASDLIDERLNQIAYEKEAKQQALLDKYHGYKVGDRISWLFEATDIVENGTISKLEEVSGKKLANIKLDGGGLLHRVDINKLQKEIKIKEEFP